MNEKHITAILSILKAAYPNSYKDLTKQSAQGVISVWTMQLADVPPEIGYIAIQKLISVNKFPPTVAEVREMVVHLSSEAKGAMWERKSRLELSRFGDEEKGEIPDYTDYERFANQIYDMTHSFQVELSLHTLMQNEIIRTAIEDPDAPSPLRLTENTKEKSGDTG